MLRWCIRYLAYFVVSHRNWRNATNILRYLHWFHPDIALLMIEFHNKCWWLISICCICAWMFYFCLFCNLITFVRLRLTQCMICPICFFVDWGSLCLCLKHRIQLHEIKIAHNEVHVSLPGFRNNYLYNSHK